MLTPEWLRAQASRLSDLADDARKNGNAAVASLIQEAATRYLDQAIALEGPVRASPVPNAATAANPTRPPPKDKE